MEILPGKSARAARSKYVTGCGLFTTFGFTEITESIFVFFSEIILCTIKKVYKYIKNLKRLKITNKNKIIKKSQKASSKIQQIF